MRQMSHFDNYSVHRQTDRQRKAVSYKLPDDSRSIRRDKLLRMFCSAAELTTWLAGARCRASAPSLCNDRYIPFKHTSFYIVLPLMQFFCLRTETFYMIRLRLRRYINHLLTYLLTCHVRTRSTAVTCTVLCSAKILRMNVFCWSIILYVHV